MTASWQERREGEDLPLVDLRTADGGKLQLFEQNHGETNYIALFKIAANGAITNRLNMSVETTLALGAALNRTARRLRRPR